MTEIQRACYESDEEGLCSPSPTETIRVSPLQISKPEVKESEADYGDFVLDRTESIDLYVEDVVRESSPSVEKSFRYHSDVGPSAKKFRAGRISDELRNALGIGKHDIPEYIYRMRKMGFINGYPPGYLKKAIERDDSNNVLQFHMLDDKVSSTDVLERADSPPPRINAEKMIYYCGFNQSYRDLRDRENFRIPPFLEFVAFHQDILNEKHARKLEARRRMHRREIKIVRKARIELSKDEVVILDPPPPPPPPSMLNNSSDEDIIIIDCESRKTPSPSQSSKVLKGSSIGIMMGTPVLTRRRLDEEAEVDEQKPSLDKFSKGIVPFEAREEQTPHKGFLKKIMGKIKKITG
ncbi:hypothetical protein DICVIV_06942 [Dictyocaulus viviparus]|uniref:PSP proline-rich domain-containing protein n=1 Tax=Dictyocaulus viviparus TaxID=29172 RepID=A0A0D8XX83_DICVI|nr:hypothetical protein DICVIV_06942 [Dictyocaulus viviparus]